jgi:hypothetical protein
MVIAEDQRRNHLVAAAVLAQQEQADQVPLLVVLVELVHRYSLLGVLQHQQVNSLAESVITQAVAVALEETGQELAV